MQFPGPGGVCKLPSVAGAPEQVQSCLLVKVPITSWLAVQAAAFLQHIHAVLQPRPATATTVTIAGKSAPGLRMQHKSSAICFQPAVATGLTRKAGLSVLTHAHIVCMVSRCMVYTCGDLEWSRQLNSSAWKADSNDLHGMTHYRVTCQVSNE